MKYGRGMRDRLWLEPNLDRGRPPGTDQVLNTATFSLDVASIFPTSTIPVSLHITLVPTPAAFSVWCPAVTIPGFVLPKLVPIKLPLSSSRRSFGTTGGGIRWPHEAISTNYFPPQIIRERGIDCYTTNRNPQEALQTAVYFPSFFPV